MHNKNVFSDKSNKTLRIPTSYRQNKKSIVPVVTARDSICKLTKTITLIKILFDNLEFYMICK